MAPERQGRRLDSWKEIAEYLGRDLRTVMRWEQRGLPVRRLPGGKRQAVFALTDELDAWLVQQQGRTLPAEAGENREQEPASSPSTDAPRTRKTLPITAAAVCGVLLLGGMLFFRFLPARSSHSVTPAREVRLEGQGFSLRFERLDTDLGIPGYSFQAGDLNHDGIPDLVFTTAPNDVLSVLIGKGDGTFQPARLYEKCPSSNGLELVDLNADGHLDIAATCTAGDTVVVLWGKGDGTFPERTEISIPGGPRFLDAGDLDGDGWPDLVVTAVARADLYVVRNRKGKFFLERLAHFQGIGAPKIFDWDSDGKPDLVVSVQLKATAALAVLRGDGRGSFGTPVIHQWPELGSAPAADLLSADLNGDGRKDLVISRWGEVLFLKNLGKGAFSSPQVLVAETGGWLAAVLDIDQDGNPDVLTTSPPRGTLILLKNRGDGTFLASRELALGPYPFPAVGADFNRDGRLDIALRVSFEGSLAILLGKAEDRSTK